MILIKKATTNLDFKSIALLADRIWKEHYTPIIGLDQVVYMLNKFQTVTAIQQQVDNGAQYFLIYHKTLEVGYISYYQREKSLFLSKIYVSSSERGQGIGKAAMEFVASEALVLGCENISLTVNKFNKNTIKAYEKMGFKKVNDLVIDVGEGYVMDDYQMEKDIS